MQNSSINEILDKYFKEDKQTSTDIFNQLCLYIYQSESGDSDLFMLAKLLKNEEDLAGLIAYYNGDTLSIPTEDDYRRCKLLAFTFYLKEVLGKSWSEIKEYLDFPENYSEFLSSISLGRRINQIKDELSKNILDLLDGVEEQEFRKLLEDTENG